MIFATLLFLLFAGSVCATTRASSGETRNTLGSPTENARKVDNKAVVEDASQVVPLKVNFEDSYEMGRKVGSGWVATAFLATHLKDNQPFVVKVSDRSECVTNEATILPQFDHENIVKFVEQRQMTSGRVANIYEYVDSGTLSDLFKLEFNRNTLLSIASELRKQLVAEHGRDMVISSDELLAFASELLEKQYTDNGTLYDHVQVELNEDQLSAIASQLLCALAALQEKHIIHRDIHLKNIMIHSDGTVKLIDFDWAVEETKATVFKERAEHMAPEIFRAETATCKADVWSVGYCVAWFRGNPRFGVPVDAFGMADPNLSRIKGSAAFMDFLQLALMTSVDERPSAVDLLQHEFVRQTAGREKEIVRGILQKRL